MSEVSRVQDGWSSHGHWIGEGQPTSPQPSLVARCGGPGICQVCKSEKSAQVSRVQEPEPVRARVDRRDELAYKIQRAVEGSPDTIRYDEDDWTRIADVVMDMFDELQRGTAHEVIEQAERRVLTEAADFIERHVSQVGPASQALAPGQAFAVKLLRDRAALRGGRRG